MRRWWVVASLVALVAGAGAALRGGGWRGPPRAPDTRRDAGRERASPPSGPEHDLVGFGRSPPRTNMCSADNSPPSARSVAEFGANGDARTQRLVAARTPPQSTPCMSRRSLEAVALLAPGVDEDVPPLVYAAAR